MPWRTCNPPSRGEDHPWRQHPAMSKRRRHSKTKQGATTRTYGRYPNDHSQRLLPTKPSSSYLNPIIRQSNSSTQAYCESKGHCNITQMTMYPGPNTVCILCFTACLEYSTVKPRSHNKLSSSIINKNNNTHHKNLRKLVNVNIRKYNYYHNFIHYTKIYPHKKLIA